MSICTRAHYILMSHIPLHVNVLYNSVSLYPMNIADHIYMQL